MDLEERQAMSTIHTYQMTEANLQACINDAIGAYVDALQRADLLSAEKAEEAKTHYAVVVFRKGRFGTFLDRLWGNEDTLQFRVVKVNA